MQAHRELRRHSYVPPALRCAPYFKVFKGGSTQMLYMEYRCKAIEKPTRTNHSCTALGTRGRQTYRPTVVAASPAASGGGDGAGCWRL